MKKFICISLLISVAVYAKAQKDCSHDHTGLIPLNDLGPEIYRGFSGGLYPEGSNIRPADHLTSCIEKVELIQPLDQYGFYNEAGNIAMLSIGASNPGSEFERFKTICSGFTPLNDNLVLINGCVGGTGIQELNLPDDGYWESVMTTLENNFITPEQVQICWLQEENTEVGDTLFPSASLDLVEDYQQLLTTIKILFPNIKICYASARTYSGYAGLDDPAVDNGLEFPRDYMNGWTVKWLIENIIDHVPGYEYEGVDATIPLVTWATYNWTDGSTPRSDGLFLDCMIDVSEDGLHLTGQGYNKIAETMFNYFKSDTTAKYWFYDEGFTGINNFVMQTAEIKVFPNPAAGDQLFIQSDIIKNNTALKYTVYSINGAVLFSADDTYSGRLNIDITTVKNGMYIISVFTGNNILNSVFCIQKP